MFPSFGSCPSEVNTIYLLTIRYLWVNQVIEAYLWVLLISIDEIILHMLIYTFVMG